MRVKTTTPNTINIITLGCSKNLYDSEVLMGQLKASGKKVVHEKEGNIVVINTCGFIDNAKDESIETILEQVERKEKGEIDKVFVTGCLSERYKEDLEKEIPQVDQYFGTTDLPHLLKVLKADYKHELIGERVLTTPKNYAYLKISEGCNRPCSFCAIPLMRGKHKSTPIEQLVDNAKNIAAQGVKELILIAQDLTFYGLDLYKERRLSDLLKALAKVEGIEWIRLHYAYPSGFPIDVIETMKAEPKICNYLDMPLQHISDSVLKSMKRGIDSTKTTDLIRTIRTLIPEICLRTTLIVGYPGETEEDFEQLKKWVEEIEFDRLGCFTYSHEENTSAHKLVDDVPQQIKEERCEEIMNIQASISWRKNQAMIGKTYKCMIDRKEGVNFVGRTEMDSPDVDNEILVNAKEHFLKIGDFVNLRIIKAEEFDLFAEPLTL